MRRATRKLAFAYPKNPPLWLPQWPPKSEIQSLFSEGIRSYAAKIIANESLPEINWEDDRLILKLGSQQAIWRLQGKRWRRSCTCGYFNDRCAHVYAAARMFQQVISCEGWNASTSVEPQSSPYDQHGENKHDKRPGQSSEQLQAVPQIEVEADFHFYHPDVALRFYLNRHGHREISRLQQILNMGIQARRQSGGAHKRWNSDDASFLIWISNRLQHHSAVRQNLNVLRLKRSEFAYWQEYWQDTPGRFIERDSQAPLQQGEGLAEIFFELHEQDEWIQIQAVVCTPNGICKPFHEIFAMLGSGKRELVLEGELLTINSPVSWDLLQEAFSKRSPRMRREHICEYLPALLEGRLDVVRGPAVRREVEVGPVALTATADGADVVLQASVAGVPVRPDAAVTADRIYDDGDSFVLVTYTCPDLKVVRDFLREFEFEMLSEGRLRLSGQPENLKLLVAGWRSLPAGISRKCDPQLRMLLEKDVELTPFLNLNEEKNFVDMHLNWRCGDIKVKDHDLRQALENKQELLRTQSGEWLRLDVDHMQKLRQTFADFGFTERGSTRHFRPETGRLLSLLKEKINLKFPEKTRSLAERLQEFEEKPVLQIPADMTDILRSYQKQGVEFLSDRCAYEVGAILADDMGLGKTLQILTLLRAAKAADFRKNGSNRLALVLCPSSVVSVWLDEVSKFCPDLRSAAYTGPPQEREALLDESQHDVLVTTYAILRNDIDKLIQQRFEFVIADEAQLIKNPHSITAQTVKMLNTAHPLAVTGTPLENRLLDLWSIMDFVNPGFLGSEESFLHRFEHSSETVSLRQRIAPVILRRTKEAVAPELPPRTEEVIKVELLPKQREIYEAAITQAREDLRNKGPVEILAALMRLRQICCHPQLVLEKPSHLKSAKLQTAKAMIREIVDEGHSVLLFSQFTQMLDLVEDSFTDIPLFKITGKTPQAQRAELVHSFQEAGTSQLFLLSLRAAGTGLTLTKADYVFIFDPWWNPAVERQAIDRTHRIGQDKPVIAYRLFAPDTIEEKVLKLQQEKAELFDKVMEESAALPARLTEDDLVALLA